jgi:hypothetical protein
VWILSVAFLLRTFQPSYSSIISMRERLLTWPIGSNRCSSLNSAPRAPRLSNVRRPRTPTSLLNNKASSHPEGCPPTSGLHRIPTALDHKVVSLEVLEAPVPIQAGLDSACLLVVPTGPRLQDGFLLGHKASTNHRVPSGLQCPLGRPASNTRVKINLQRVRRGLHQVGHR